MTSERIAATPRSGFVRRARPLLGTLVEIGVADPQGPPLGDRGKAAHGADAAIDAAFARIAEIQAALSRFDPRSSIGRFNAAAAGAAIAIGEDARVVLAAAGELCAASSGVFDITLGTGPDGWAREGSLLRKLDDDVRLDLGGIAKGHAVDAAIAALRQAGVAAGWVNAGGDLRVFGALAVPIDLRDEHGGGVRRFATLEDGAFATSWIAGPAQASDHRDRGERPPRHASVAADRCLWADALTKVVALTGDVDHPLVAARGARAWLH
ncbi:MAG: FAD:protein FMN transferase [Polyangia bacterium]